MCTMSPPYPTMLPPSPPASPQAKQYSSSLIQYTRNLMAQVVSDEEDKRGREQQQWRGQLNSGVICVNGKRGSEDKVVVVTEVEQARRRRAQSISKSGAKYI